MVNSCCQCGADAAHGRIGGLCILRRAVHSDLPSLPSHGSLRTTVPCPISFIQDTSSSGTRAGFSMTTMIDLLKPNGHCRSARSLKPAPRAASRSTAIISSLVRITALAPERRTRAHSMSAGA
eukprot:scaffold257180_cov31-Tisochrysis_lutea.AAC.1